MIGRLYWGSGLKTKSEIAEYFEFAFKNSNSADCKARYLYHTAVVSLEQSDKKKYFDCLRNASLLGHAEAAYLVGAFYHRGLYDQAPSRELSRIYLERARSLGHRAAPCLLEKIPLWVLLEFSGFGCPQRVQGVLLFEDSSVGNALTRPAVKKDVFQEFDVPEQKIVLKKHKILNRISGFGLHFS